MTQNPYAQQPGFDTNMPVAARTSVAAILSLVCALICPIPGLSILAIILGIAALVMIGSSQGRVTGKGLAISGIFIGLLVTLLWGGAYLMFRSLSQMVGQQFMGNATAFFQATEAKNYSQARTILNTPSGRPTATDAEFDAFLAAYTAEVGSFQSMPDGFISLIGSYTKLQSFNMQQLAPGQIPIPTEFSNGTAVVLLEMEQPGTSPSATSISLVNIGILSQSGTTIWLVPKPAPAGNTPTGTNPTGGGGTSPPPPPPSGNGG